MRRNSLLFVPLLAAALLLIQPARSQEPSRDSLPPALKKASQLVGGTWETTFKQPNGEPAGVFTWRWAEDGVTLLSSGRLTLGSKAMDVNARLGWDAGAKKVYYLDTHGTTSVYFGHVEMQGEELIYEFRDLIGARGHWRSRETFTGPDTVVALMFPLKDGKEVGQAQRIELRRRR